MPSVAIVGYTNAGKSSLLNALTGAGVLVENALFATLEPTTRRGEFDDGRAFVLTDTVGFVRHLPTQLVEAFRSTLEEVVDADLLVHVVDGSDANPLAQINAVRQVVNDVVAETRRAGAAGTVGGQQDRRRRRSRPWPSCAGRCPTRCSCRRTPATGWTGCRPRMAEMIAPRDTVVDVTIPYDRGDLVNRVHAEGRVDAVEHTESGTRIKARVPVSLAAGLAGFTTY